MNLADQARQVTGNYRVIGNIGRNDLSREFDQLVIFKLFLNHLRAPGTALS